MRIKKNYLFILIAFSVGIVVGLLFSNYKHVESSFDELRAGGYKFVNPLYECNVSENVGAVQFKDLERDISDYVENMVSHSSIDRVSVYFRDLNNGPWIGIDEDSDFSPASLLKIPIMIAFYKKAESDPSILDKKILYKEGTIPTEIPRNDPENPLKGGSEYTVSQLIDKMITESDNVATTLLKQAIPNEEIDKVKRDLGISTQKTLTDFISTREYSSLFRILFNASYLDNDYSEKALELLSRSKYKEGLTKPIPASIPVAHKFGERKKVNNLTGKTIDQLHDCGIIYYTDRPYLLCVMTEGTGYENLTKVIQEISKIVLDEYNERYSSK